MTAQVAMIKATLKYRTHEEFVRGMTPLISKRGMFIHTRQTRPAGAQIKFEFTLADGSQTYTGEGTVRKEVPFDANAPTQKSGMLVALQRVNHAFKDVVDTILSSKEEAARQEDAGQAQETEQVQETEQAQETEQVQEAEQVQEKPERNYQRIVETHAGEGVDLFGDLDMDEGLDSLFSSIEKTPSHTASASTGFVKLTMTNADQVSEKEPEEDLDIQSEQTDDAEILDDSYQPVISNDLFAAPPSQKTAEYSENALSGDSTEAVTGEHEAVEFIAQAERAVYEQSALLSNNGQKWPEEVSPELKSTPASPISAAVEEQYAFETAQHEMEEQLNPFTQNDPFAAHDEFVHETDGAQNFFDDEQPAHDEFVHETDGAQNFFDDEPAHDEFVHETEGAQNLFDDEPAHDEFVPEINFAQNLFDDEQPSQDAFTPENDAAQDMTIEQEPAMDQAMAADSFDEALFATQQVPAMTRINIADEIEKSEAEQADEELNAITSADTAFDAASPVEMHQERSATLSGFPASEETPSGLFAALQDDIGLESTDSPVIEPEAISAPAEIDQKPIEIERKQHEVDPRLLINPEPAKAAQPSPIPSAQSALDELLGKPVSKAPETSSMNLLDVDPNSPIAGFNQNAARRSVKEPATLESVLKQTDVKTKDVVMTNVNPRKATPRKRNTANEPQEPQVPTEKKGGFFSSLFKK